MDVPEELEFALETVEPDEKQRVLEAWENMTAQERNFVMMAINLDVCQEHFYEKRREQLGL